MPPPRMRPARRHRTSYLRSLTSSPDNRRGEPTMQNQGSFGDSFDNMKEGAAQIGGAVADAASAVVASAASDAKTAVANTAQKVAKKAAKAKKQAARTVRTVVAKAKSAVAKKKPA